ncbi:MAG TPA: hypothetical protein EYO73_00890 [Sulfurimonas sp.]|nr:hypothetical protein [Sulfurimonas sp.]
MIQDILIFGYNEYAKKVSSNCLLDNNRVHIYVIDEASFLSAKNDGFRVELVELDDDWDIIGKEFDVDEITCFCILDDDAENVFLTISLRAEYENIEIVSLATSKDSADKLRLAGANKALAKLETTANVIVEFLETPVVTEVMNDILYRNKDLKLAEYTIKQNSILDGKFLHEIELHKKHNIIILAIADIELEADFSFTYEGQTHMVDVGDTLVVMGKEKDLENFEINILEEVTNKDSL